MHSEGILTSPCTYEAGFISRTAPGSGSGNDAGLSSLATASSITRTAARRASWAASCSPATVSDQMGQESPEGGGSPSPRSTRE